MIVLAEITRVITDAALDRANRDVSTGLINWEYVAEDVKYFFRDEIAESAEFEMKVSSELFAFIKKYEEMA